MIELVIKIPEEAYNEIRLRGLSLCPRDEINIVKAIRNGTLLPKGHGRLKDEDYFLNLLQCEDYETCTWRNCSECNREKSIKNYHVVDAPTIIEADNEDK